MRVKGGHLVGMPNDGGDDGGGDGAGDEGEGDGDAATAWRAA